MRRPGIRTVAVLLVLLLSGSLLADITGGTVRSVRLPETDRPDQKREVFLSLWADTFATFCYTFADITLFSYHDSTELEVQDELGTIIWSGTLNEDEYRVLTPGIGLYEVRGSNAYSVLVGDAVSGHYSGYFAVDDQSRPLSTKLLTYVPDAIWGEELLAVFAYQDLSEATITNLNTGAVIWSGTLNAGEHHEVAISDISIKVESDKPVSVLSYADQGYHIPAVEGTFYGTLFYTYVGYIGDWQNDLNLMAFEDSTNINVSYTGSGVPIWTGVLDAGEAHSVTSVRDDYVTIDSDKPLTACVSPFESWPGGYHYFTRAVDSTGHGIGTLFFVPAVDSGQLDIFSFQDGASVEVVNLGTDSTEWSGVLDRGEHYSHYTTYALYLVTSTQPITVYDSFGGEFGADFAPLELVAPPGVEEESEARGRKQEARLMQNYPNPFSRTTNIRYRLVPTGIEGIPDGASPVHTSLTVYDLSGRLVRTLVDECKRPGSYSVSWCGTDETGTEIPPGVYFCRLKAGDFVAAKKLVVLR